MQTNNKRYHHALSSRWFSIMLCLTLCLTTSCNNDDDVIDIFVGNNKTWKLTLISRDGSHEPYDFWNGNEQAYNASRDALAKDGNFVLNFEGGTTGVTTGGAMNGRGIKSAFNGNWNIGEGRNLTITLQNNPSEADPLAKAFVNGLKGVTRYEGDTENLYLFYTDGQTNMRMSFHVQQ